VRPYLWLARANRHDLLDAASDAVAGLCRLCWLALSDTQTGRLRAYVLGLALGVVAYVALVMRP
jgi:NADH-quinone oxidoreductase subunit L